MSVSRRLSAFGGSTVLLLVPRPSPRPGPGTACACAVSPSFLVLGYLCNPLRIILWFYYSSGYFLCYAIPKRWRHFAVLLTSEAHKRSEQTILGTVKNACGFTACYPEKLLSYLAHAHAVDTKLVTTCNIRAHALVQKSPDCHNISGPHILLVGAQHIRLAQLPLRCKGPMEIYERLCLCSLCLLECLCDFVFFLCGLSSSPSSPAQYIHTQPIELHTFTHV